MDRRCRTPSSREQVFDAALDYLAQHGLPALSMRKLGACRSAGWPGCALAAYPWVGPWTWSTWWPRSPSAIRSPRRAGHPGTRGSEPNLDDRADELDPAEFPNLTEIIATRAGLDFESGFTEAIDILLAGYAARPAPSSRSRSR